MNEAIKNVPVSELAKNTNLEVLFGSEFLDRKITVPDISRPGLVMSGYFDHYTPERVQLLGVNEISYAQTLSKQQRTVVFEQMADDQTPAFIVSTSQEVPEELLSVARKSHIPVLRTQQTSSRILSNMTYFLGSELSPRETLHGVLIDIYGLGILITGDAGVGKSEAALELIQQGKARLIADDRVDVYAQDEQHLVGQPSQVLRNLMEVRGVGIVDIFQTYGAAAIRSHATIVLNIHLSSAAINDQSFDRLGNKNDFLSILSMKIKKMTVPVTPGRSTSSVIDIAALKYRTEAMGLDALATLENRMSQAQQGEIQ